MTDQAELLDLPQKRRRSSAGSSRTSTKRQALDFFVTPGWATEALLEREVFPGKVWEPACGDGAISRLFVAAGYRVRSTDLAVRRFSPSGGVDFLAQDTAPGVGSIVTNPPFARWTEFAAHALRLGVRKVALLSKVTSLEGIGRQRLFAEHPPSRVWVFARRVNMHAGDKVGDGPAEIQGIAFSWFVWERHHTGTQIGWIP